MFNDLVSCISYHVSCFRWLLIHRAATAKGGRRPPARPARSRPALSLSLPRMDRHTPPGEANARSLTASEAALASLVRWASTHGHRPSRFGLFVNSMDAWLVTSRMDGCQPSITSPQSLRRLFIGIASIFFKLFFLLSLLGALMPPFFSFLS